MQTAPLHRLRRRRASQRGMTLIEIMVVLVILGMMAGAIAWNVFGQQKDSQIKMAQTETKTIADAVDMFRLKHSKMPETLNELMPNEVRKLRPDPWGNAYVLVKGSGDEFEIISYGPDKSQGGTDDISSNAVSAGPGGK